VSPASGPEPVRGFRQPAGRFTAHACSLNHETTPQVSNLSSHGGGIPARLETGVGRSMRMRLRPERYRKRTYGAEPVSHLLLAAACRHQPQQPASIYACILSCDNARTCNSPWTVQRMPMRVLGAARGSAGSWRHVLSAPVLVRPTGNYTWVPLRNLYAERMQA
jgi:hypothetical protein